MNPDLVIYFVAIPDWIKNEVFIPTRLHGAKDWFGGSAHCALRDELIRTVAVDCSWTNEENDRWGKKGVPINHLVVTTKPNVTRENVLKVIDMFQPGLYGAIDNDNGISHHLISYLSSDMDGVIIGYIAGEKEQRLEKRGVSYIFSDQRNSATMLRKKCVSRKRSQKGTTT